MDGKLKDILRDFMVNKMGAKIMNLASFEKYIVKRVMNCTLLLSALHSGVKLIESQIDESPKALQLILALSCRCEVEIMSAYKRKHYDETPTIILEIFPFYKPQMMSIMEQEVMQRTDNHLVLVDSKDNHDPKLENIDLFYDHVFGQIPAMITKHGENKPLIRLFVLLSNSGHDRLKKYPRIMISIQSNDIQIKKLINNRVYNKLIDPKHPIDIFQTALAKRRYNEALDIIPKKMQEIKTTKLNSKNPWKFVKSLKAKYQVHKDMSDYNDYRDKITSMEQMYLDAVENNCIMFTKIIYGQKYKNDKVLFTQKMYQFYARGMIRFKNEDIVGTIPKLFEDKSLVMSQSVMDKMLKGRNVKYANDVGFEEFEKEFAEFRKGKMSKRERELMEEHNAYYCDDDDDDDDEDDEEAVEYEPPKLVENYVNNGEEYVERKREEQKIEVVPDRITQAPEMHDSMTNLDASLLSELCEIVDQCWDNKG